MSIKQRTLKADVTLTGKGLIQVLMLILLSNRLLSGHGFKFCRIDLPEKPIINAIAENVTDTSRGTTLKENGATVATIEHVLALSMG